MERRIEDGLMSVDIALTDRMVAVEVDGSSHFSANEPFVPLGKSVLRWRMLASRGWKVRAPGGSEWGGCGGNRSMSEKGEGSASVCQHSRPRPKVPAPQH